ncbi:hypothetical protein [Bradyrhizobium sp. JYMT SZCCT0180]|uniref:hypothetical protein n=1 Tax=Bradyrhizobium sp. JYMT SZCCT0180 TaxID=2807666 RepID=UPI001BA597F6|nr:hypothetical protein [Bradyrhizobium sp. JYMT SZCCT0180]MBR1210954.1 hypothetical protein [Bradyrhizobium sp. JYMT SZCCT0180]
MMSVTQTDPPPRPPLLDQVIRFLVWFTVLGFIATPLVVLTMTYGHVLGSVAGRNNDRFQQILEQAGPRDEPASKPGIVTSVLDKERGRQIARLRALTGRPEMASGTTASLQIIAVAFDSTKPGGGGTSSQARQAVDQDGYRVLQLDLKQAPRDAVVIIADQPIRWRLQGLTPGSAPRVGFEGYAAFDVSDAQPGSLAGFRIGAFGAPSFARPVDPTGGEVSNRQGLCTSLQNWADHFGLPFDAIRYTLLLNPSRITPTSGLAQSDGSTDKTMYAGDLDRLCKQRARR